MRIIFTVLFILSALCSFPQSQKIDKAKDLVDNRQYESAIITLNEADPNNEIPEVVIFKTDIFLNYFVSSMMHQMFAVKDLGKDEELIDIRGSEGEYTMFFFPPDSILSKLISKHSDNYKLYKTLGYYYHEVHLKYGQNWLIPDSVVIKLFTENYLIAYENGFSDYWSLYGIGYSYLLEQDYQNAITYLEKSTQLKDDYPSSYYNLAYANLYLDQSEKAIECAKKAMELYDYPSYKADAARMIAVIYKELNNSEKAYEYLIQADEIQPNDYYTLKSKLDIELKLINNSYKKTTEDFFLIAPGNPTIYQDLMNIYWEYSKPKELIGFLEKQHKKFINDYKVDGNLYFYVGAIQYDIGDSINSKKNFEQSKMTFKQVFDPDHRVFEIIDSYLEKL